jgi:uroporphyrinogen III methyltransferase/synthase
VFTSINGVAYFCNRMKEKGLPFTELKGRRIACVGEATAAELHHYGLSPDYIPEEQSSEELLAALSRMVKLSGQKLLLPRGDLASPLLRDGLRKQGAMVSDPVVYRNVPDPEGGQALRSELEAGHVDVVCFSSPSAANNAIKVLADRAASLLGRVRVYSIGPMTSRALTEHGIKLAGEAKQHDMPGLVDAVVKAESGRGGK